MRSRWLVGLTILALLAAGGIALADSGFAGRGVGDRTDCPRASEDAYCVVDTDGDGIVNSEDPDWVCPEDGNGCGQGAGVCLGFESNRSANVPNAQCAAGIGQRVGGCRGGRF